MSKQNTTATKSAAAAATSKKVARAAKPKRTPQEIEFIKTARKERNIERRELQYKRVTLLQQVFDAAKVEGGDPTAVILALRPQIDAIDKRIAELSVPRRTRTLRVPRGWNVDETGNGAFAEIAAGPVSVVAKLDATTLEWSVKVLGQNDSVKLIASGSALRLPNALSMANGCLRSTAKTAAKMYR